MAAAPSSNGSSTHSRRTTPSSFSASSTCRSAKRRAANYFQSVGAPATSSTRWFEAPLRPASSCSRDAAFSTSNDRAAVFNSRRQRAASRVDSWSLRPVANRCRKPEATAPDSSSRGASGTAIVPATPALVPLLLDATHKDAIHRELSGVSHDVDLAVWIDGRISTRLSGSLLWTHFGISGPVTLNASRHWLRAVLEQRPVRLTAGLCAGVTFDSQESWWMEATRRAAEGIGVDGTLGANAGSSCCRRRSSSRD